MNNLIIRGKTDKCGWCNNAGPSWFMTKAATGGPFGEYWEAYTCSEHLDDALDDAFISAPGGKRIMVERA